MGARVGEEDVGGMEEVRGFRDRWCREGWEPRVRGGAWLERISIGWSGKVYIKIITYGIVHWGLRRVICIWGVCPVSEPCDRKAS